MSARSSHKGFAASHVLPHNPSFLEFPRSDGDTANWPSNTTHRVDNEGHVNYMRFVDLDEPISIKWRTDVGAALALRLNMSPGNSYVLQGWPDGYRMFDHNKGPKDTPRHDIYLIGSAYAKRFRSVPEFIPHALWLLTDPALDRTNCSCKYCNKKPQREITASMGLLPKRAGSVPSTLTTPSRSNPQPFRLKRQPHSFKDKISPRDREKPVREKERPFVGVRRAPKPIKQPAPKQSMLRERNADLSTAYGPQVKVRRWYREGELLWCALDSPIVGPSGLGFDDSILFWPAIVEETRMKPISMRKDLVIDPVGGSSNVHSNLNSSSSDGDDMPWIIKHVLSYKMKLLGVSHSLYISDDCVLPYQSVAPPDELIQAIHDVPPEQLNRDPVRVSAFNPFSTSRQDVSFADAAAPYGIALQIGANIAGYWAPTDDWEFKFTLEPPNTGIPHPSKPISTFQSLDAVMNSSMTYNANLATSLATTSGSGSNTPSISALPAPPLALGQTVAQTRYQGLWWGAERIWTDDLIRLKFSRSQVAPQGNDLINAPAGPSKKALEYAQAMGGEVGGAEGRGMFLRLEGLFVADPSSGKGTKVCHAVGTLYELVDEDWEEEDMEVVFGKGKGKASANSSASACGTPAVDAVSIEVTMTDDHSHNNIPGVQSTSAPKLDSNSALSHPVLSSPFPLPAAPDGFKFRPILKSGTELVVDLTWIAGRYYPGILRHRLLDRHVERALASGEGQLWALEGITAGCYNSMDPTRWKLTRSLMVREADHDARAGLEEHWRNKEREHQEAKVVDGAFLPPVPLSGVAKNGTEGPGLGEIPSVSGTIGQGGESFDGVHGEGSWKAFKNGLEDHDAMLVD